MKLQRFFQVGQRFFFCFTLAGDVNVKALGNVPVTFSGYRRRKWPFHNGIVSQLRGVGGGSVQGLKPQLFVGPNSTA